MELTEQQNEVLKFIRAFVSKRGFPPTRQEIADSFGWAYASAAESHLRAIERKGRITITPGISRGIVIK